MVRSNITRYITLLPENMPVDLLLLNLETRLFSRILVAYGVSKRAPVVGGIRKCSQREFQVSYYGYSARHESLCASEMILMCATTHRILPLNPAEPGLRWAGENSLRGESVRTYTM